jgi:hypothetical protein
VIGTAALGTKGNCKGAQAFRGVGADRPSGQAGDDSRPCGLDDVAGAEQVDQFLRDVARAIGRKP